MTDTALDLITNALLDLGVLADGETPTASQASGGLRKLNNLIDSWNIQPYAVYGQTAYVFPLVSNQATYTIGPGGNFNIPRPNSIMSAYVRDTTVPTANQADFPVVLLSPDEWQNAPFKGLTQAQPYYAYINYAFPLAQLTLYPIPSSSQFNLVLWVSGLISDLTINQVISVPPGYSRALESNLAIELAASYEVQVSDTINAIAADSLRDLKAVNFYLSELQGIAPVQYDITTNRYLSPPA